MNEVKRKQRLEEVTDELCGYKWYGNEEDEDYKKEYSMEYSHLLKEKEELEKKKWIIKTKIHNIEWSGEDWDGLPEEVSIDLPIEKGVTDFGIKRTHKIIRRFVGEFYQRKIIHSGLEYGERLNSSLN